MWVEPDCNLSGGESLVRQLLYGRSYFKDRFGSMETPLAWLPDTFGFTPSLPQLLRQAGIRWFGSNKLNWNQYNKLPHNLFRWEGIDGSQITAFFLTTPKPVQYLPFPTTYKAEMTAEEVFGTWDEFGQKATHNELPICFGYGDGGGGPTRELIMTARNYGRLPGVPKVRMGTLREFFEGVDARATEELPIWVGELYLELHRGTFTSQAKIKKLNRACETLLHDAEFLSSYAAEIASLDYPADELTRCWKSVCLNQFHDILPGTSIAEVFADAERDYTAVQKSAKAICADAMTALATTAPKDAVALVANTTGFTMDRACVVAHAGPLADAESGEALASQAVEGGTLVTVPDMPANGLRALAKSSDAAPQTGLTTGKEDGTLWIENDLLRVEVARRSGQLTRIWDKEAGREVLAPGQTGNQLLAFEDRPMQWDAWDIDIYYEDRCDTIDHAESVEFVETGPVRAAIRTRHEWRGSRFEQRIEMHHNSKRIDFRTEVDWKAQKTLLKVAFPVDIHAKDATYDIQFGNTQRPTHRNTSWDWARFEVVGHKWADLSEGNYGVALLNDCKYGYDIQKNVMRLSLLKGATMPDPSQDQHVHRFTYALLPHAGNWREGVAAQAYDLNIAPHVIDLDTPSTGGDAPAFVSCNIGTAVIETVKQAEDGGGHVVRLYESAGNRGPVRLKFGFPVATAAISDILESAGETLPVEDNAVTVDLTPYKIVTLRINSG